MSHVYVVVATRDSEIEACETFDGVRAALGRGFQLAADRSGRGRTDLFIPDPGEKTWPDGSVRWVFMNTNQQSVVVIYRKIEEAMLSSKDPLSAANMSLPKHIDMIGPLPIQPPPPPVYDFMDPDLPVGWFQDGKPAFMKDMVTNPFDVVDPLDLTENQKWALVTVRARKRGGFKVVPRGYNGYHADQITALKELGRRLQLGLDIRDGEIDNLHHAREDLMAG